MFCDGFSYIVFLLGYSTNTSLLSCAFSFSISDIFVLI